MSQRGIVLYFQVHQPNRAKPYTVFDTGIDHTYFDTASNAPWDNKAVFLKVAEKSYRPMNALLLQLLNTYPDFRVSLSITGVFIEQAREWAPDVLEGFKRLVETGRVELLAETYHHSLAFFFSQAEFERQVKQHEVLMQETFGVTPRVFRNTELAYNNDLGQWAESRGYKGILSEGWNPILEWRSPNYLYRPYGTSNIALLLKNYQLSDDIAFRFSNRDWPEFPLTANKYHTWVNQSLGDQDIMNLFMDYETFGEHQWEDTGIFNFFSEFVGSWIREYGNSFYTVSEAIDTFEPKEALSMPYTVTWADSGRDLSAWTGNKLQQEALRYVYSMEDDILRTGDESLIRDWRALQTSDHFYYMCTKGFGDGEVHAYFSPYDSPYVAFLYYLNIIRDLRWRLHTQHKAGVLHG
jgi:alpha-amylase